MSYYIGIDAGSTTVKIAILDENLNTIYKIYERHFSKVKECIKRKFDELKELLEGENLSICITGSAGLGLSNSSQLSFIQEVVAADVAIKNRFDDIDVCIELGGEDAKILFLTGGVEERMNGTCAGGTGAFIDQMASLMNLSAGDINTLAKDYQKIYPIASRCGVFAKSDIQPLLNQGASKSDIAASIYDAVVIQSITGLAQGRQIAGKILFLGGPLKFSSELVAAFKKHLNLSDECAVVPDDGEYFIALGAALKASQSSELLTYQELLRRLSFTQKIQKKQNLKPLFEDEAEYAEFKRRHTAHAVEKNDISTYVGEAFLGIDSGSTTLKIALIDTNARLLYSFYGSNEGNPLEIVKQKLICIKKLCQDRITISGATATGYGEELMMAAFGIDFGIVETVAHLSGARHFSPDVDFIIDIGGQDMKSFGIKNGQISSVTLNEACSSGCGSFLSSFAKSLGYEIADFATLALRSKNPANLGSRCTVFMNSSVKQAQKDGASVEDISAGLAISVVKNAIYKVLRVNDTQELGNNIVVQGGTFLNDAVLRAFEMELKKDVLRMDQSEIMGAFGAALFARKNSLHSTLISLEELEKFSYKSGEAVCKKCTNRCALNIIKFQNRPNFIAGNRCERGAGKERRKDLGNLYEFKRNYLLNLPVSSFDIKVGIPLALNMYEMYPFWAAFFNELGMEAVISRDIDSKTMLQASSTIPSDTVCYPAKLVHSHILNLASRKDLDFIFYPCMSYNIDEKIAQNHYNCPVVAYYPELIGANVSDLNNFVSDHIDLKNRDFLAQKLAQILSKFKPLDKSDILLACEAGFKGLNLYKQCVQDEGERVLKSLKGDAVVLAARPYHIDPLINHGIDLLLNTLGFAVLSEDSLPLSYTQTKTLNQWTYHARMYNGAKFVCEHDNLHLVQLVSFGCGIDAITADEIEAILREKDKIYTQLKIDEITNLGGVKIRLRSLKATILEKKTQKKESL